MLPLTTTRPFSFSRSLEFMGRFPACRDACVFGPDRVTTAVTVDHRAHAYTLREHSGSVVLETTAPRSVHPKLQHHAEHLLGARDDLAPFYAAARDDAPLAALIDELHGLHHVRFATLADAVVYSILMQRAPMNVAAALKRKFLARLGLATTHGGETLHAMPELGALATLTADDIAAAIGHRPKAARIATVAREVHAIGEDFLRTARYEVAQAALLEIDGIGPFAATAILLRGLGRMDSLPWMPQFARAAQVVYGRTVTESAIAKRYGRHIGYWSFYVMTAAARRGLH